jgi:4'-phosphopantetheinyl transferase EntD
MTRTDTQLQAAIDGFRLPGILIDHRLISAGDELALLPEENAAFANSVVKVRRASGAARIVARELLSRLGHVRCSLRKSESGATIWPDGVTGSLAHDSRVALAAIARRDRMDALGIDIEPAEFLPPDLLDIVATLQERQMIGNDLLAARLLFVVKEAVYKAVHPLDRKFLEHKDVEVDLSAHVAYVRNGRVVDFRYRISTHMVAVAFIAASLQAPNSNGG